jgi:hypothetical protein
MKSRIRIAQFGLGPIGLATLKEVSTKSWAEVIGAVEIDPSKQGKDLGALTRTPALRGRTVYSGLEELLRKVKPDLIFHTAVSHLSTAFSQIEPIVRRGISVVSSCEELVFPYLREPGMAKKIDRICKSSGARIVATGVNPGFVMDVLVLCLTGVSCNVRAIHVQRVVNASTRRESLQRKIGSGMPPGEFERLLTEGAAGHAGLKESLCLISHKLDWKPVSIVEKKHAVVAERDIKTACFHVKKGQTCGLHQRAEARIGGKLRLTLDLKMYLDAENPHDSIRIEGEPPLDMVMRGGVAGDQATIAALVNTAPRALAARPGLLLMTDLPLPSFAP